MKRLLLATTACSLAASLSPSLAGSVLQPGATVGIPAGAPLAEGVYFVNTSDYGQRTNTQAGLGVNMTSVLWATPFTFYDTRLQFFFLQPTAYTTNTNNDRFYGNSTLFSGQLAHTFGNGFGVSYLSGIRTAQPSPLAFRKNSFEQRGAITYNGNGFNLTANVANGAFWGESANMMYPNWLNLDLTATKKFDTFEIGAVAFGSTDITSPTPAYKRQGQIAVGGLVGHNFGKFTLQAYVTRDVAKRAYTGYDTRGWARLIVPLYVAPVAPEPLRARF